MDGWTLGGATLGRRCGHGHRGVAERQLGGVEAPSSAPRAERRRLATARGRAGALGERRRAQWSPPPWAERRRRTTMSGRAGEWRTLWSASKVDATSDARQAIEEDSVE